MWLVCVTTEYNHYGSCPIEVGKSYKVSDNSRTWGDKYRMISIIVDGQPFEFVKDSFIPLQEIRNKKIEDILR